MEPKVDKVAFYEPKVLPELAEGEILFMELLVEFDGLCCGN